MAKLNKREQETGRKTVNTTFIKAAFKTNLKLYCSCLSQVFGDKDDDGFYWGECRLNQGFVPSNMITEMNIDEAEDLFNRAKNDVRYNNELNSNGQLNGELDVDVISDNLGCEENDRLSFWENLDADDHFGAKKMKALYDYDPVRDSPNVDSEVCDASAP